MKQVTGWWFAPKNKKLANGDNREIKIGITHSLDSEIIPCRYGLHLSKRPIDALAYATSSIIYKVVGFGTIVPHGDPIDKYACSKRKYIGGGLDISETLRHFARLCALDVIHLWDAPDVVIEYLNTGNEKLRAAARDAARAAAGDAVWDAAWEKQNKRLTRMIKDAIKVDTLGKEGG